MPTIGLSDEFLEKLDTGMSSVIDLINGAGYFIPLDVLVICLGSILAFQMAKLKLWLEDFMEKTYNEIENLYEIMAAKKQKFLTLRTYV